jgi:hypothetical protein
VREIGITGSGRCSQDEGAELVIHKGALLADPQRAMEGNGRYRGAIPFRTPDEIDADVVAPILRQAADRETDVPPSEPS